MHSFVLFPLLLFPLLLPFLPLLTTRARVLGITRTRNSIPNVHGHGLRVIPGTEMCEDLHLHEGSGLLFTACQGDMESRYLWFPPLDGARDREGVTKGGLVVVDPKTFTATKLTLENFPHPFVTHGIDIVPHPKDPSTLHILAVNHLPNPWHYLAPAGTTASPNKTRSQIDIFSHKIGTATATHLRTIQHPGIHTPNDIYAMSPTEFYVTNDHHYRTGLRRGIEDLLTQRWAPWSTTMHVQIDEMHPTGGPADGITVTTALRGLHNNNGLGHASPDRPDEVLIVDASGGVLTRAKRQNTFSPTLSILEQIQLPSTLDNPSYYTDPYATPSSNASGYVLAGLARAMALSTEWDKPERPIPVTVWHVRSNGVKGEEHAKWEQRVIFQDDGRKVRSASAAVMVAMPPEEWEGERKQAWLFVTGFLTEGVVGVRVDL